MQSNLDDVTRICINCTVEKFSFDLEANVVIELLLLKPSSCLVVGELTCLRAMFEYKRRAERSEITVEYRQQTAELQ